MADVHLYLDQHQRYVIVNCSSFTKIISRPDNIDEQHVWNRCFEKFVNAHNGNDINNGDIIAVIFIQLYCHELCIDDIVVYYQFLYITIKHFCHDFDMISYFQHVFNVACCYQFLQTGNHNALVPTPDGSQYYVEYRNIHKTVQVLYFGNQYDISRRISCCFQVIDDKTLILLSYWYNQ
jgi:hypothetical protein